MSRPALATATLALSLASACSSSDSTTPTTSTGTPPTLSLPQFVHGAARVDTAAFPQIPVVVGVEGAMPDAVTVEVDGKGTQAVAGDGRFVAMVDAASLGAGTHAVVARGGAAKVEGSLVADGGSLQFTEFAAAGPAHGPSLFHDIEGDALLYSWVSTPGGKHELRMGRLDGAFARIDGDDVLLNDPAEEALGGVTAVGKDAIGVVYRAPKPGGGQWLVKMRVLDRKGVAKAPTMDLTAGEAAYIPIRTTADPGGFPAVWLHIPPTVDPKAPPPTELRFARWDALANALVGPIVIDTDQPPPPSGADGPQYIEPLAELGLACNDAICVVIYARRRFDALLAMNVPKLFYAVVDIAGGKLVGTPEPVWAKSWDTQEFGQHIIAQADGSFVLVYTASSLADPATACDNVMPRDVFRVARFSASGSLVSGGGMLLDHEAAREYPRLAALPSGYALFWEDERDACEPGGKIRMAAGVAAADLTGMIEPYLEMPGSVGLSLQQPTLAVTGTSFVVSWPDNRHGKGMTDLKPELYLDTYWRQ